MNKLLKNNRWISLIEAAEPLATILGRKIMTGDDVLDLFTDNRITASVRIKSTPLLVWPLVRLTGQDAEQFKQDEQRTETYRGKSFTIKGEFWVPHREDADSMTILQGGRVLDLPLSPDTRNFLQRLQDNPVPPGKRLRLPRGTLTQIPETGEYFVTVEILEVPDVFCEIVIRTEVILEFERQLKALETEPLSLPAVALGASETKEQRQDRCLKLCEDAGLIMPRSHSSRLPNGVGDIADTENKTRQAFSADVKAALKRRESAIREGSTVHRA